MTTVGKDEEQARSAVFPAADAQGDDDSRQEAQVRGYEFNTLSFDLSTFLSSFSTTGFTATALSRAIDLVNKMRAWRDPDDPSQRCRIFLGYTSNQVSSGNRDIIRYLVQHKFVDVLVTTAGGVEEDLIKCLAPSWVLKAGADTRGSDLRRMGMNRIGNLCVPNNNYCLFEDWLMPLLDELSASDAWLTPSKLIKHLGGKIDNEESIYYWASKNDIPVFCPALTDGSLGDMLYFHSFRSDNPIKLDIVQDLRSINSLAVHSKCTGAIILGGGLVKHHIMNANLMRNGADYAVFINTAQEFDGSDAGAPPDEAVSWGKIKVGADAVKVCCDATIAFPLLVAGSFHVEYANTRDSICRALSEQLYL